MAILVGLLVAAAFGGGDFLGGLASREANTLTVLAAAQLTAVLGAAVFAVAAGHMPGPAVFGLGAAAGLLNVTALGCLYQALAIGQIGEVAPVAAVVGSVLPVAWGLAVGERPGVLPLVGVALAVAAGGMISLERDERHGWRFGHALLLAVAAGVGFGTSLILFADVSHHGGFWPVLSARVAALVAVSLVVVATATPRVLPPRPRWRALLAGLLEVTGTALLLVAIRHGLVAVVAPVASLAPAVTVLGAWWFLKERASRLQVAGLGLALTGLVLIAL